MKSYFASAVKKCKPAFIAAMILAGIIFIFIGLNAASNPPAGQAPSASISDGRVKIGHPGKPEKPIYSADASASTMSPQAARFYGKNGVPTGSPETRSADFPKYILILLIIGVFGYIWVHADGLLKAPKSDKIRINLMPRSINREADGVLFIHRGDEGQGFAQK